MAAINGPAAAGSVFLGGNARKQLLPRRKRDPFYLLSSLRSFPFLVLSSTMDGEGELSNDWELLHNARPSSHVVDPPPPFSGDFHGVDGDSEGIVQSDYFALDSDKRSSALVTSRVSEENYSTDSDNPSWIDPGSDHRYGGDGKAAVGLGMSGGFWSDSSGDESVQGKTEMNQYNPDSYEFRLDGVVTEQLFVEGSGEGESGVEEGSLEAGGHAPPAGDGEKRCIVWWKLPFHLKLYAFRIGPLWSLSVAAAALGLVILWRKLYRMKRRARRLRINKGVDDKVSPLRIQATRFNEALTGVKHVPVRLPLLMPGTVAPWPVLGLR